MSNQVLSLINLPVKIKQTLKCGIYITRECHNTVLPTYDNDVFRLIYSNMIIDNETNPFFKIIVSS